MKIYFSLFFLIIFSFNARSDEYCYEKMVQYEAAHKVSQIWVKELQKPNFKAKDLCVWPEKNSEVDVFFAKLRKPYLRLMNMGKVEIYSIRDFEFLDGEGLPSELSNEQICDYAKGRPPEDATCELTESYLLEAQAAYFTAIGPMVNFCKKNIDELARRVQRCQKQNK